LYHVFQRGLDRESNLEFSYHLCKCGRLTTERWRPWKRGSIYTRHKSPWCVLAIKKKSGVN
jgi:hypothetical protein